MTITKNSICSEGALLLGKEPFTDVDTDATPSSQKFVAIYEQTLYDLLAEHHWSFATREAKLLEALIPVPAMSEYAHYFDLPSDFLTFIQYGFDQDNPDYTQDKYRLEGGYLLSNDTDVYIKYTARIGVPYLFPPLFAELLSIKLAYKLAYSLVSSVSLRDELAALYERKLSIAIGRDQREDKSTYTNTNRIDIVRRCGYVY